MKIVLDNKIFVELGNLNIINYYVHNQMKIIRE